MQRDRIKKAATCGEQATAARNVVNAGANDTPILPQNRLAVKLSPKVCITYLIEKAARHVWQAANARLLAMLAGGEG